MSKTYKFNLPGTFFNGDTLRRNGWNENYKIVVTCELKNDLWSIKTDNPNDVFSFADERAIKRLILEKEAKKKQKRDQKTTVEKLGWTEPPKKNRLFKISVVVSHYWDKKNSNPYFSASIAFAYKDESIEVKNLGSQYGNKDQGCYIVNQMIKQLFMLEGYPSSFEKQLKVPICVSYQEVKRYKDL